MYSLNRDRLQFIKLGAFCTLFLTFIQKEDGLVRHAIGDGRPQLALCCVIGQRGHTWLTTLTLSDNQTLQQVHSLAGPF